MSKKKNDEMDDVNLSTVENVYTENQNSQVNPGAVICDSVTKSNETSRAKDRGVDEQAPEVRCLEVVKEKDLAASSQGTGKTNTNDGEKLNMQAPSRTPINVASSARAVTVMVQTSSKTPPKPKKPKKKKDKDKKGGSWFGWCTGWFTGLFGDKGEPEALRKQRKKIYICAGLNIFVFALTGVFFMFAFLSTVALEFEEMFYVFLIVLIILLVYKICYIVLLFMLARKDKPKGKKLALGVLLAHWILHFVFAIIALICGVAKVSSYSWNTGLLVFGIIHIVVAIAIGTVDFLFIRPFVRPPKKA